MDKDCYYIVEQRERYSSFVKRYAYYETAHEASLHGSLNAAKPYYHSQELPSGTQGVDWVLYNHLDHTNE